MSLLDKISDRVGGFLDEVLLPEEVARSLRRAAQAIDAEDYDAALRILYRTHTEHPDFHRIHHLIGLCKFHQRAFEEALQAFDRAVDQREEIVSHLYAALSAEQLGRYHEAQVHFRRGLELGAGSPLEFDLLFGLGRAYLSQGRADKAVRELRKATNRYPDQPQAAVTLARALLQRSKLDEAQEVLRTPAARSAGLATSVLRGELEEARGRPQAALDAYREALDADPDHEAALVGSARSSLAVGDHRQANEYLLRALDAAEPDNLAEIHALLGRTNEAIANRERALECFETSLGIDQTRIDARLGAGRVLLGMGELDAAHDHFQEVAEAAGADDDARREALTGLATVSLEHGDLGDARRLIDALLQQTAEPPVDVLHLQGKVALASGDAAEAVVAFEQAVLTAGDRRIEALEADLRAALGELTFDWQLPDRLDDSTDVIEVLHQLRDFVASDARTDHLLPSVQRMLGTLNSPLSIAIVGEFNAGKSTLLNAMIGEEVVPMGVLPTTAHTCYIQYGPRKAARVVRDDGEVVEVNLDEAKRQMKTNADQIDHLEFVYPHPDLRSVEFWDTPGFNALEDAHEDTASRALEQAEAILWVLDANQALTHSEFELIESIPDGAERLIVLLNKIDRLGAPGERDAQTEELLAYVEENASGRIAGCFAMSALEALEAHKRRSDAVPDVEDESDRFDAFRAFLESRIIERSGRIKTLEIARQIGEVVDELEALEASLIDKYDALGREAEALGQWLAELADQRPRERALEQARSLEDRFDFVLTGIEREIREALTSRGTWLTRAVLTEEDKQFILDLLSERLEDVLNRSRQQVSSDVDEMESNLAQQVGQIAGELPLGDARAMNRRLEGFFDESRVLKLLLEERVYGQLSARATGQIEAAGRRALEEIRHSSQHDGTEWKAGLRQLLPDTRAHLSRELAAWYEEFFLAASRFCDRVRRDLHLLKLEAEHHLDVSALAEMT